MDKLDDVAVLVLLLAGGLLMTGVSGLFRYGHGLGERSYRFFHASRTVGAVVLPIGLALLLLAWIVNGEIAVD